MRARAFPSLVVAGAWLAGAAEAGPLISASWRQSIAGIEITVTGTDSSYGGFPDFGDRVLDTGSGSCTDTLTHVQQMISCPTALLGSGDSPYSSQFSVSLALPAFSLSQFDTAGAVAFHTLATVAGGPLAIYGSQFGKLSIGSVPGMVTVKAANHAEHTGVSMWTGKTTLVKVPLSIGKAGRATGYFYLQDDIHYLTVDFYAWTPGTKVFAGLTTNGVALPDVVAMGSWDPINHSISSLPPMSWPPSTVTLVAPSRVSIDGPLAQRRTASFTSLTLSFVNSAPEPSTWLLLGTGMLGLLRMGARRR